MVRTELYTSGGEFALPDGSAYIGAYHIHDIQGPMTGAYHKQTPHDSLTPLNKKTEAFVQTVTRQLKSNTVRSSARSGSGGGGY